MSVWVDIKHAKKDGRHYDLWVVGRGKKRGHRVTDCYWSFARDGITHKPLVDQYFDGWCCDVGKPGPNSWNPYPNLIEGIATHFMLIPDPPVT